MCLLPYYLQELLLSVIFLHYFLLSHHHALRIHPCTKYISDVLILCVAVLLESLLLCLHHRTFLQHSFYLSSRTSHVFFLHPHFSGSYWKFLKVSLAVSALFCNTTACSLTDVIKLSSILSTKSLKGMNFLAKYYYYRINMPQEKLTVFPKY